MHGYVLSRSRANHLLVFAMLTAFLAITGTTFGQTMNEDLKLLPNDGGADHEFGNAIALDNGVVAIGARHDDDNGIDSGSAYLFDATTGAEIVKLLPTDGAAGDAFGFSIDIADGIVAVGAPGKGDNGAGSGAAYLFSAVTGTQLAKLTANDAAAGDEFGNSIAIDNGIVAVGAWRADEYGDGSGAAYLFDASMGNQLDKLLPDTGNNYQTFGVSMAMDAGIVAIGARSYFVLGEGYTFARAYLFDVSTGNQLNVLRADIENYNGDLGGHFADCIDIDNGLVAVGAPYRSIFFDFSGAAYVFDASTGEQLHFIFPADGHDRDHFGISISIDNSALAIGAHQDGDNGWVSGSAYLYDVSGNLITKFLASDGAQFDYFGEAVAIDNGVVAVGAIGDEDNGADSGSAYLGTVAGAGGDLLIDTSILSASQGGTVNFTLNAGGDNGNRNYLILGSMSGSFPGIPLPGGGETLPVNWDNFTNLVLRKLNSGIFTDFLGSLDIEGTGAAQLNVSSVNPSKIGKIMTYAYCLEGNPDWDFVSNPVEIEIVP